MLAGHPPEIHGDGTQSRDFTYVRNAVQACMLAAKARLEASGETMNIACGERITLLDLVDQLNGLLDRSLRPMFTAPRPGDVHHSLASIEKAERLIGYRPEVSAREGIEATVDWFVSEAKTAGVSR
jgi:nucleoside-diphosphate-sugar epimerase